MTHKFVETIPHQPEENVLYISMEFETATHLCACGCKEKVVTPIGVGGWKLIKHEGSVSLDPSIGNFRIPCKSHYFIRKNKVEWV